jgi:ATP-binding cassette subfamily B protein
MKRRLFVPEVIQSSATDCGPAALKALFAGFGTYLSYGRLREACQTDVDGTSIDTLEELANTLGLATEQRIVPADLITDRALGCVPSIVVLRLPGGATHFAVLWRVHGRLVQIMDPAAGRVWLPRLRFLASLYIHQQSVPAAAWADYADGDDLASALRRRLRSIGIHEDLWDDRTHMDASLRVVSALVASGKVGRGVPAADLLRRCREHPEQIPETYWSARPVAGDPECVIVKGAVVLAVTASEPETETTPLSPSIAAIRNERPPRWLAPVWGAIAEGGLALLLLIALSLLAAAAGVVLEALMFQGLLELTRHLTMTGERIAALAIVLGFTATLLVLEWSARSGVLGIGRRLELRLRQQILFAIPRLGDRYFRSRLISDMAFRAHSLHLLRQLPELAGELLRLSAALTATTIAIVWLYPDAAFQAAAAAIAAVGVPLLFQPALAERDLRVREASASLSRFYLDALLGATAVRAHAAERALLAAQAPQLEAWADAGLRQQAALVYAEAAQMLGATGPVVWLVMTEAGRSHTPAGFLLLAYWALSIPSLGQQIATILWGVPPLRNTTLRFLEPLNADVNASAQASGQPLPRSGAPSRAGIRVEAVDVSAVAGGQPILDSITLRVNAGEHVAIVGSSGAGKSSLVGLLLGWHTPAQGRLLVDGEPLDARALERIRRDTAWIDPQVHLFRRPLLDNLLYGNADDGESRVGWAMEASGLPGVLRRLPEGLQTPLGDRGTLVAGGEGQRVRIGRAFVAANVRLAILDEPGRGLDRAGRRAVLARARRQFAGATVFAITHDISDALDFDLVLVVEHGRIVEDGSPRAFCASSTSRFRALLDAELAVRRGLWENGGWRRLRMDRGKIVEAENREVHEWTLA